MKKGEDEQRRMLGSKGSFARCRLSGNFQRGILWILGGFLVSIFAISCASQPPKYEIYPTLRIADRLTLPGCDDSDPFDHWKKHFDREQKAMVDNEWLPTLDLLNNTLDEAMKEYGVLPENAPDVSLARSAFFEKFKLEGDSENLETDPEKKVDPRENCVRCRVKRMLFSIDYEHPNLLVEASRLKEAPTANSYALPSLVSSGYPIDVALTRWTATARPESKQAGGTKVDEANCDTKKDEGKARAEQTKAKPSLVEDFKPEQTITLSLSTVLNSPGVTDRIEYVSTYIYVQPFPFPPNGEVVLEKDFWMRFFALNATRDARVKKAATLSDMMRAIESMRVRVSNTDTTVVYRDLDFGTLTRKTTDKFTVDIGATAAAPPSVTGITPKLGYSGGVDTDTQMKLQQQLDQRSTYVDPSGHFLRITQRGMQSVNLAGRFVENVTLSIPSAQEQVPVLVPVQESEKAVDYQVRWLSQPLYSRVDALTLSVVVARQATALAISTKDSFRLDDPRDAAFIAAVTQPYRITLWQHERELWEVMTWDIFGKSNAPNEKVFFTAYEGGRLAPLSLFGFTPEQRHTLFRKIRDEAGSDSNQPVSLKVEDDNKACQTIRIGLGDPKGMPSNLLGF